MRNCREVAAKVPRMSSALEHYFGEGSAFGEDLDFLGLLDTNGTLNDRNFSERDKRVFAS